MRKPFKPFWECSNDCPECQGKGMIFAGLEGYVNHNLEQDVRDTYLPCMRAELVEPDWDAIRDEQRDRKLLREE